MDMLLHISASHRATMLSNLGSAFLIGMMKGMDSAPSPSSIDPSMSGTKGMSAALKTGCPKGSQAGLRGRH